MKLGSKALSERLVDEINVSRYRKSDDLTVNSMAEISTNVKELHVLMRELSDANKKLSQLDDVQATFLSTISHELLTPITTVQGYISLMKDGHTGHVSDQQHEMLKVAEKQISHLSNVVKKLLELNWLQSEKISLKNEPFDAVAILGSCLDSFEQQVRDKGIVFSSNIGELSNIIINGNSEKFSMIFLNIIDNAIKFTPSGGSVEVIVNDSKSRVDIEVKDSGIGIEKQYVNNICEPFYQIDNKSTRRYDGLGIGLALAKGLIKLHNGTIKFDSISPQGVRVKLSFPKIKS